MLDKALDLRVCKKTVYHNLHEKFIFTMPFSGNLAYCLF
jgi:hypothetical protein